MHSFASQARSRLRNYVHNYTMFLPHLFLLNAALVAFFMFAPIYPGDGQAGQLQKRYWGGYNPTAPSEKCYRQERVAILLSVFLGTLGVDQFYAHHWVLAVFKLLTGGGLGVWTIVDIVLWVIGSHYDTPGCPN